MSASDLERIYIETLAREHAARGYTYHQAAGAAPSQPGVPPPGATNGAAPVSPMAGMLPMLLPMLTKNMADDHPLKALLPMLMSGLGGGQPGAAAPAATSETQRLLMETVQRTVNDNSARAAAALEESKRVAADLVDLKSLHNRLLAAVDEHTRVLKSLRTELPALVAASVAEYFEKETAPSAASSENGHNSNGTNGAAAHQGE